MGDLKKQERTAIEAVARRFSATWEMGSGLRDAYLIVAGRRVALEIATLRRRGPGQANAAKLRLRHDKVVARLTERLEVACGKTVPAGMTVLVTITAPIRLASKTAAALEDKIQTLVGRGSTGRDAKATIHANRVRIRLLKDESGRAPKLIGFVHNSDADPLLLLNMTCDLLELPSAAAARRAPRVARRSTADRWQVLISPRGSSSLEGYRTVYSQLRIATDYKKILMVFGDGRVGILKG